MERRKAEAMTAKQHKARGEISLSCKIKMRVTLKMIQIQTKLMTNTYYNFERECDENYK